MDEIKFEISDYYDLLNLHKALMEAKFHPNPNNSCVAGSPVIAKMFNEIDDLLAIHDMKEKGKEDWTEWRKLSNHEDIKMLVIKSISAFGRWGRLDDKGKTECILNYISPFTCSYDEITAIKNDIDELEKLKLRLEK